MWPLITLIMLILSGPKAEPKTTIINTNKTEHRIHRKEQVLNTLVNLTAKGSRFFCFKLVLFSRLGRLCEKDEFFTCNLPSSYIVNKNSSLSDVTL